MRRANPTTQTVPHQTAPRDAITTALPLAGRVALVVGSDRVSLSAVAALLAAGADVVVAAPSAEKRARFTAHARLHILPICLATDHGAMQAKRRIARTFGRLDLVIAALGSWPPTDRVVADVRFRWQRTLDPSMDAHYSLARTLLPLMAQGDGAQYLLLNDGAAGAGMTEWLLLKDALAAEARDVGVGVHAAVLAPDVAAAAVLGGRVAGIAGRLLTTDSRRSRIFRVGQVAGGVSPYRTMSAGDVADVGFAA